MNYILILTLITFLIFAVSYTMEKRNLFTGFSFLLFLSSLLLTLFMLLLTDIQNHSGISLSFVLMIFILTILLSIMLVGPLLLIFSLIYNGLVVIKKEGRSLSHMLSLALGIILLLNLITLRWLSPYLTRGGFIAGVYSYIQILLFYLLLTASLFTVSSFINYFNFKRQNLDYIVVLGAGLNKDKVTPLLASRINKAIKIHKKNKNSKIIMSGEKGSDEMISEALAMKNYALEQGIRNKDIILEDKSTSTEENIKFSKAIIGENKNTAIVTNYYHLLRALMLAKEEGLKCIGYGAKTKFYYTQTAYIRELIAYFSMTRTFHLILITIITLIFVLLHSPLLAIILKNVFSS